MQHVLDLFTANNNNAFRQHSLPGNFIYAIRCDRRLTTHRACIANRDTFLLYPRRNGTFIRALQRIKITPIIRFQIMSFHHKHHGTNNTNTKRWRCRFFATFLCRSISLSYSLAHRLSSISVFLLSSSVSVPLSVISTENQSDIKT